jgi:hypothetical protein
LAESRSVDAEALDAVIRDTVDADATISFEALPDRATAIGSWSIRQWREQIARRPI